MGKKFDEIEPGKTASLPWQVADVQLYDAYKRCMWTWNAEWQSDPREIDDSTWIILVPVHYVGKSNGNVELKES